MPTDSASVAYILMLNRTYLYIKKSTSTHLILKHLLINYFLEKMFMWLIFFVQAKKVTEALAVYILIYVYNGSCLCKMGENDLWIYCGNGLLSWKMTKVLIYLQILDF
jgi:hypothetical protein